MFGSSKVSNVVENAMNNNVVNVNGRNVSVLALVLGIWAITFIFFTNMHQKLTDGYDHSIVDRLVQMNWARTALWSLRLIILLSI